MVSLGQRHAATGPKIQIIVRCQGDREHGIKKCKKEVSLANLAVLGTIDMLEYLRPTFWRITYSNPGWRGHWNRDFREARQPQRDVIPLWNELAKGLMIEGEGCCT
jgi:hypothetical protein